MKIENMEYLTLWCHKSKLRNLVDLSIQESLLYLDLTWANIHNFIGIEKMANLKRLELHYCTKLQTDSSLSGLADMLEHLHINQSKKSSQMRSYSLWKTFQFFALILAVIWRICIFSNQFPRLIEFRFVDTNVLDGELSPILDCPTIRSVGFLNKRHYNIKDDKVNAMLKNKNGGEKFKTVIKFREYENFIHIY